MKSIQHLSSEKNGHTFLKVVQSGKSICKNSNFRTSTCCISMTRRNWTDFLVFWKDLNALPDMSFTDVSPCHFSFLSEKNNPSARDKEETWQGERSVKFILGSAIRPFQNTKKLCLIPSSHRDTACRSSKIAIFADWKSGFEGTMPL